LTRFKTPRAFARRLVLPRTLDVFRFRTFFSGYEVKDNLFAWRERFMTFSQHSRVMQEHVLPAVLGDKAITVRLIPPFDFSTCHNVPLPNAKGWLLVRALQSFFVRGQIDYWYSNYLGTELTLGPCRKAVKGFL
jgi:hypothetical protein